MKVLPAQINVIPGNWSHNLAQIQEGLDIGVKQKCDLIVFPEMALSGCCFDKMFSKKFVTHNLEGLQDIIMLSRALPHKPYIVLGYVDTNYSGGRLLKNMAAVIRDGLLLGTYQKQNLSRHPTLMEDRYFEPGSAPFFIHMCGRRWGIVISDDLWQDRYMYFEKTTPAQQLKDAEIKDVICISASPFAENKVPARIEVMKGVSSYEHASIYVNQQGSSDSLVFDGSSFVINKNSLQKLYTGADKYEVVNLESSGGPNIYSGHSVSAVPSRRAAIVLAIREFFEKHDFDGVAIGSSGGIDSATTLLLACEAIGSQNVHGVRMPKEEDSAGNDIARQLHESVECQDHEIPITLGQYTGFAGFDLDVRNLALRQFAKQNKYLLLSTTNLVERAVGHCNAIGHFAPLHDLFHAQVVSLFNSYDNPTKVLKKKELQAESLTLPLNIWDAIVLAYFKDDVDNFEWFMSWCHLQFHSTKPHYQKSLDPDCELDPTVQRWFSSKPKDAYSEAIRLIETNELKRRQIAVGLQLNSWSGNKHLPLSPKFRT